MARSGGALTPRPCWQCACNTFTCVLILLARLPGHLVLSPVLPPLRAPRAGTQQALLGNALEQAQRAQQEAAASKAQQVPSEASFVAIKPAGVGPVRMLQLGG